MKRSKFSEEQIAYALRQVESGPPVDVSPKNDGRAKLEYAGAFDGPSHERTGPMKPSSFSEEQVAYALRHVEAGTPVEDGCRQLGVSEATFYAWKKHVLHLEEEGRPPGRE